MWQTNVQDNSAVNFLPKRGDKWVHNNSTVNLNFSVRKLIFWQASSKITLVFPSPKTNLLSDLPKNYFLETQFSGEFQFSMPVSRSLGNSPNDSNSPLTFSSVKDDNVFLNPVNRNKF